MFSIIDNICFAPRMCVIYVNVTSTSVNRGGAASSGHALVVPIAKPQYRFCLCSPVLPAILIARIRTEKKQPHIRTETQPPTRRMFSPGIIYILLLSPWFSHLSLFLPLFPSLQTITVSGASHSPSHSLTYTNPPQKTSWTRNTCCFVI